MSDGCKKCWGNGWIRNAGNPSREQEICTECNGSGLGRVVTFQNPELVEIHGISYIDKATHSQLSTERQLELLKNNLALAMKRIYTYRDSQPVLIQAAIDECMEQLEYLTSIKINHENNINDSTTTGLDDGAGCSSSDGAAE